MLNKEKILKSYCEIFQYAKITKNLKKKYYD